MPPRPSLARPQRQVGDREVVAQGVEPTEARPGGRRGSPGPARPRRAAAARRSLPRRRRRGRAGRSRGWTVSGSNTAPAASTDPVGPSTSGWATAWAGSASVPASATAAAASGSTWPSTSTTRSPVVAANPTLAVVAIPRSAWIVTRVEPGEACGQHRQHDVLPAGEPHADHDQLDVDGRGGCERVGDAADPARGRPDRAERRQHHARPPRHALRGDRGRPVDEVARGDDREPGRRLLGADPRAGVVGLVVDVVDADVAHQVEVGGAGELEDQVVVDAAAQALVEAARPPRPARGGPPAR